jgi:hypothetical protein
MTTRDSSDKQERRIARLLGGTVQSNSGGTRFGGGDVHTPLFLVEAKTNARPKGSFTIKQEWIDKMNEQKFEQGKLFASLAISFDNTHDYFLVDARTFQRMHKLIAEDFKFSPESEVK